MLLETMTNKEYTDAMLLYSGALREMNTRLEIINEEFAVRLNNNPIEHIKSRLKSPASTAAKLVRKGFAPTMENAVLYVDDLAGVRIVCSFTADIYHVAAVVKSQPYIRVLRLKDYIANPKPTGYRSYHMLVEVPVHMSGHTQNAKVEIQIRTIAMDFWASLEHKIRYKFNGAIPAELNEDLSACANMAAALDNRMYELNKEIEKYK